MGYVEAKAWLDDCIRAEEFRASTEYLSNEIRRCEILHDRNRIHLYEGIGILADMLKEKLSNDGEKLFFVYKGYIIFQLLGAKNV